MVDDLTAKFLEEYNKNDERSKVSEYACYFLGSIIISKTNENSFIIDGQQRLTSLTLLIIFLNNRYRDGNYKDDISLKDLIFSTKFAKKSFNLDVDERTQCMEALFKDQIYDVSDENESIQNIHARYKNIEDIFPEEIDKHALPYFIDWVEEKIYLVEITASSDRDAYTIFETMNDRGLSLNSVEMLKGFLLSNVNKEKRINAEEQWKEQITELTKHGKESASEFFKAWFRSQYATKIRDRKKGAKQEDFEKIGTEFHRWIKDANNINISWGQSSAVLDFIETDLDFYSKQYMRLLDASKKKIKGFEHVYYNVCNGFTLQYMLLLAPLKPTDTQEIIDKKVKIIARYIDTLLVWRFWNFRRNSYSTMLYAMFLIMREIRDFSQPDDLAKFLSDKLKSETENLNNNSNNDLYLHQQNKKAIHYILARITDYIETESGMASCFEEYINGSNIKYEVEHIWANHYDRHKGKFDHENNFLAYRNRIGGLLLLPKKFNASYNDATYEVKLKYYPTQNLLAKSLNPICYEKNPGFLKFKNTTSLSFEAIADFNKEAIDNRGKLYLEIAKLIWNPDSLLNQQ